MTPCLDRIHILGIVRGAWPFRCIQPSITKILSIPGKQAMWQAAWLDHDGIVSAEHSQLETSLHSMQQRFPSFLCEAEAAGWLMNDIVIRSENVRFTVMQEG